jgi:hypothetical protein
MTKRSLRSLTAADFDEISRDAGARVLAEHQATGRPLIGHDDNGVLIERDPNTMQTRPYRKPEDRT